MVRIFPHSDLIQENTDKNNTKYDTFYAVTVGSDANIRLKFERFQNLTK